MRCLGSLPGADGGVDFECSGPFAPLLLLALDGGIVVLPGWMLDSILKFRAVILAAGSLVELMIDLVGDYRAWQRCRQRLGLTVE